MNPKIRGPLASGVYDPPLAPQQPPTPPAPMGQAKDIEAVTVRLKTIGTGEDVAVYSTKQRWNACDGFVQYNGQLQSGQIISFLVYARAGQTRTLVATGRFGRATQYGVQPAMGAWVAGARCTAESFDVVASLNSGAALSEELQITVAASDDTTDVPDWVGAVPCADQMQTADGILWPGISPACPFPEIVGVFGVNMTAATQLYLCMSELGNGFAVPGNGCRFAWPLPAGGGYVDNAFRYRRRSVSAVNDSIVFCISTDPTSISVAALGDGAFQVYFR